MSTTETEKKELVRQFMQEVWNEGNVDRVEEYFAEDFVEHNSSVPEEARSPDDFKQNVRQIRDAFPDFTVTVEDLVAEDDRVGVRITQQGTHRGEFMGIEPTGNEMAVQGLSIARFEDGKAVETWVQIDTMGMLQQLGVVERPGRQSSGEDTTATSTRENKELVQRFIRELVNGKNYDLAEELFTADYTRHDPDTPGDEQGVESFVEALKELHEAFPDSEVHVGEIVAEDDLVAFEGTLTGTHEGVFRGIEPTNTQIEIPGNAMHRVRDGRIAETWATWNFLGALQQLGAVEPPGE